MFLPKVRGSHNSKLFRRLPTDQSQKGKRPGFQTFLLQAGPPRSAQIKKSFSQSRDLRKTITKRTGFQPSYLLTYCKKELAQEKRLIFFNF